MNSIIILWSYVVIINVITFIVYGTDKYKAKHHLWRISEQMLFFLTTLGGSIGALVSMLIFRHKTKKTIFKYGIPIVLLVQIILLVKLLI